MRLLSPFVCTSYMNPTSLLVCNTTFWQGSVPPGLLFRETGKNASVVWSEFRCRSQLQLQWLYGNVHGVRQRHIEYLCYGFLCSIYSLAFFRPCCVYETCECFSHENVELSHTTTPLAANTHQTLISVRMGMLGERSNAQDQRQSARNMELDCCQ